MRIRITDPTDGQGAEELGDFDTEWAKLGQQIKDQLRTWDPDRTWLNLYVSHDGRPAMSKTIQRDTE